MAPAPEREEVEEVPIRYDPVTGKYAIGEGRPRFKTREAAERAWEGYRKRFGEEEAPRPRPGRRRRRKASRRS